MISGSVILEDLYRRDLLDDSRDLPKVSATMILVEAWLFSDKSEQKASLYNSCRTWDFLPVREQASPVP